MSNIVRVVLGLTIAAVVSVGAATPEKRKVIQAAIAEGDFDRARDILEGDTHGQAEADRLELLTEVCNAQSDYKAGIRYGERAVAASPHSSNAHFQYAIAIRNKMNSGGRMKAMLAMGSYKKALRKALELDPKNVAALEEQIGFLIKAPGIAGGDSKQARKLIPTLKALDKTRGLKMEVLFENTHGDPTRVAQLFSEALDANPEDLELRNRYAVHLQKQDRFRDADAEFRRIAAGHNVQLARLALYQRARTRILGRFEQDAAIEMLAQYLELVPENRPRLPTRSNAYWRMGTAYEQLGQYSKARGAYTTALKLNPKNAQAKQALKGLRDRRS